MSDQLISREALKKKFERLVDETIPYGGVAVNDMRELIDNAPTVPNEYMRGYEAAEREYKRPQGEWIVKCKSTFPQYQPDEYECSFCKTIVNYKTNYCENCGADMRNITETPSSCITTNPNSVEAYHQSLKGGAERTKVAELDKMPMISKKHKGGAK